MAELTNKLNITKNGTTYECTCYTTEEEGTPDNGSCWEIKNNGVTAYIGLWPKSITTGGHHSSLTAKKNNIEYWVETEVDKGFDLHYYARNNIENYRSVNSIPEENIAELNLTGKKIKADASYAFSTCQSLSEFPTSVVTTWDMSTVTNISHMFELTNFVSSFGDLSNWDVKHVTTATHMFDSCLGLTSIGDLSDWDLSDMVDMSYMFYNCQNLTAIGDLSNWNISNVINMQHLFSGCKKITSLGDLSEWNTSNVTNMAGVFNGCNELTTIGDISDWDVSNVTNMRLMFYHCSAIPSFDFLSPWNVSNVTDMTSMFAYTNVTTFDLSDWDTGSVTNMDGMFQYCSKLASINFLYNWNTNNVTNISAMFRGSKITEANLSAWNTGKVKSMTALFEGCTQLADVNINNWDTSKVTSFGYLFSGCSSLPVVNISQWNTSSATAIYEMFRNCSQLTSIDLSNWDTSNVTSMYGVFRNCYNITAIDISNWDTNRVTNVSKIENMFLGDDNLEYLVIDSDTFKFQMIDPECGSLNATCKILVPEALLDTYKTAENWSARADQFDAVENYTVTRSNGQVSVVPKSNGLRFKAGTSTANADLITIPAGVTAIRCWCEDESGSVSSAWHDSPVTPGETYYFAKSMADQQHYYVVYLVKASDDTTVDEVVRIPGLNLGNTTVIPAYIIVEYLMRIGDAVTVGTMNGDQFTDFSITIPSNINVVKLLLTRAQVAAQGGVDCMNRESPYTIWGEVTGTNGNYEFYVGVTPNKTYNLRLNIHISNGGGSCSVYYSDSINAQTPDVTDY